jgi:uncharacterized membrane protein HdeD (DUF308 family)
MHGHVEPVRDPVVPARMYPSWYYDVQGLLMVITGLVLLVMPVHSSKLTSGIITLYLILIGFVSILSVISDMSEMGWKFIIGITGLVLLMVSMYYFFQNSFVITGILFLGFLTLMYLIIGAVQIARGFSLGDPLIRLVGVNTVVVGLIIMPCLYFSEWWAQDIIGIVVITGGLGCYLLKNSGKPRSKTAFY